MTSAPSPRRVATIAAFAIGVLLLLAPALINGQPFFMADTTAYVRGADATAYRLTGRPSDWSGEYLRRFGDHRQPAAVAAGRPAVPREDAGAPVVLAGRSIYYGMFLYVADRLGSLWWAVVAQAVLAAICIQRTIVHLRRVSGGEARAIDLPVVASVLAGLTSAGYFVGYLLPDIFSAFAILSVGHLLFFHRTRRIETMFWTGLLATSLLVHESNFPIALGTAAVATLTAPLLGARPRLAGWMSIGLALAIGVAGAVIFHIGVKAFTGDAPVRPPFLTARLIADGPGRAYLEATCPGNGFRICRFLPDIPRHSDNFLWGDRRPDGLFSALPYDERRAIAAEQTRFVLAVVGDRPLAVVQSSLGAIGRQFGQLRLGEFNYDAAARATFAAKLPPRVYAGVRNSAAYREAMPVALVERVTPPAILLSLLILAWHLVRERRTGNPAVGLSIVVIAGIVVDNVVCGAMSTPHDRYQMRVLWLLPMLALVVAIVLAHARRHRRRAIGPQAIASDS